MALSFFSVRAEVLLGALICFIGFHVYTTSRSRAMRNKIMEANSCKPACFYLHKAPLGIDLLLENTQNIKERKFHERRAKRIDILSTTYRQKIFNRTGKQWRMKDLRRLRLIPPVTITAEPENIKTVLAIQRQDYVMDVFRVDAFCRFSRAWNIFLGWEGLAAFESHGQP